MCIKHAGFRSILTNSEFKGIAAVIVDEAHCIAQWGGDFRTAYSELSKLRSFFPPDIPILAVSATLSGPALREVRASLGIDVDTSFFLNLGNDRPNLAYSVHEIKSADDYDSLKPFLTRTTHAPATSDDLVKSLIFVNAVNTSQIVTRTIRSWLPPQLRKYVQFLHAHRSPQAKRRIMRQFRDGEILILIATEAAGMVRYLT